MAVTLLLVTTGFLTIMLILMDFVAVYAARRAALKAADAAALGALQAWMPLVRAEFERRVETKVQRLYLAAAQAADQAAHDFRAEVERERERRLAEPDADPDAVEAYAREQLAFISAVRQAAWEGHIRSRVRNAAVAHGVLARAPIADWRAFIEEFLSEAERGCGALAAYGSGAALREAAAFYSQANGGTPPHRLEVRHENLEVQVWVGRRLTLPAFDFLLPERHRELRIGSAAHARLYGGLAVGVPRFCP